MTGEEWAATFRPEHLDGTPAALESLPAGVALTRAAPRPQLIRFQSLDGVRLEVAITAFP